MSDYIAVKLVKKSWKKKDGTSGKSWCFTNRGGGADGQFQGHNYSCSILGGVDSDPRVAFCWFNDMSDDEAQAFVEEYGADGYVHAPTGKPLTMAQYQALDVSDSPSIQPQAS